jgi:uncharacterized protein
VRWLLDKGAGINERAEGGWTAVWLACHKGHAPVVRLLLERGADPTFNNCWGQTPLRIACPGAPHLEVVQLLLGHPGARATLNTEDGNGMTALGWACWGGRGAVVRALLESGADPTIADDDGMTPMAIAKQDPDDDDISAESRRECVAELEVRSPPPPSAPALLRISWLEQGVLCPHLGRG